ncbi:MAG: outer membrane beta-barrel protein [Alphaproteobacteria bacterium]|nr:outer membrane beta-barrel protein [Alphaproteobacteria bacterium]
MSERMICGAVAFASTMSCAVALFAQTPAGNDQPAGQTPSGELPAAPTAMTTPVMPGPLMANPNPVSFDLGPLGPVYLTGAVSGLGLWQNNPFPDDQRSLGSLTNGQFFFQKPEGLFQYYVQVGAYTVPSLGAPYFNTPKATGDFFGPLPLAWAKVAPTDTLSIQGGKIPTLIGAENTFTFQNLNIERGLLWGQEPAISRGGQLNYTADPLAFSVSLNDGFYSNRYTWLSGSFTYTLDKSNNIVLAAGGNYAHTAKATTTTPFFQTTVTPLFQNNETLFTLVYNYTAAPWTITPYFQYTHVPAASTIGAFSSAATYGGAILASYSFSEDSPLSGFSLPIRFEYISSIGSLASGSPNLLYGPGSNAWSVTLTPTYQYQIFFARAEFSHVGANSTTPGLAFGRDGMNTTQTRVLFEAGILF